MHVCINIVLWMKWETKTIEMLNSLKNTTATQHLCPHGKPILLILANATQKSLSLPPHLIPNTSALQIICIAYMCILPHSNTPHAVNNQKKCCKGLEQCD